MSPFFQDASVKTLFKAGDGAKQQNPFRFGQPDASLSESSLHETPHFNPLKATNSEQQSFASSKHSMSAAKVVKNQRGETNNLAFADQLMEESKAGAEMQISSLPEATLKKIKESVENRLT